MSPTKEMNLIWKSRALYKVNYGSYALIMHLMDAARRVTNKMGKKDERKLD